MLASESFVSLASLQKRFESSDLAISDSDIAEVWLHPPPTAARPCFALQLATSSLELAARASASRNNHGARRCEPTR